MIKDILIQSRKPLLITTIFILLCLFSSLYVVDGTSTNVLKSEHVLVQKISATTLQDKNKEEFEKSTESEEIIQKKLNHLLDEDLIESLSFEFIDITSNGGVMFTSLVDFLEDNYSLIIENRIAGNDIQVVITMTEKGYKFQIIVNTINDEVQNNQSNNSSLISVIQKIKYTLVLYQDMEVYNNDINLLHKHINCVKTVVLRN